VALVLEQTIPTERSPLVGVVPTFAGRGCRVASATDPYGRTSGILDRKPKKYAGVIAAGR
jgi:hypothetical protein